MSPLPNFAKNSFNEDLIKNCIDSVVAYMYVAVEYAGEVGEFAVLLGTHHVRWLSPGVRVHGTLTPAESEANCQASPGLPADSTPQLHCQVYPRRPRAAVHSGE